MDQEPMKPSSQYLRSVNSSRAPTSSLPEIITYPIEYNMDKKPDWNVLRNIANPVSNLAQSSSLFCLQLILGNDGELCGLRCGPQVSH